MNLQDICLQVNDLAKEVGAFIRGEAGKVKREEIEVKFHNNLVSYVDKTAEEKLVEGLQKIVPDAGFIVEENTVGRSENAYQWVVDPLDGTTNFLHNIPSYAVSIALMKDEELLVGVVYEVNRGECFYAWKNGGAYLNGQPIKVSQTADCQQSLFATGFPYYDFSIFDNYQKVLQHLMKNSKGIRRLGAAAVDLCYVACGRFDGFFEHSLNAWDVAAGSLIVQEAGGKVCDFKGGNNFLFAHEIVASNPLIYTDFFQIVNRYLGRDNS